MESVRRSVFIHFLAYLPEEHSAYLRSFFYTPVLFFQPKVDGVFFSFFLFPFVPSISSGEVHTFFSP